MGVKLNAALGGSVELVPTNTASNYTATMPAKTGTVGMDGPAFSAYQGSAQGSFAGASDTKVLFDTEEFDTNNNFASSRFTPTVAGYYQLNANVRVDGNVTRIITKIFKNGSVYKSGADVNGGAVNMPAATLVYANGSTDYFEVYVYATGGTPTLTATGTANIFFNGCLVRGA